MTRSTQMEATMTRSLSSARRYLLAGALLSALALPASVLAATIGGTPGNDLLVGTSVADTMNGLGGDDLILGAGGDDAIDGGIGRDALFGGAGNDKVFGGDDGDVLFGGGGIDDLNGDNGDDFIYAAGDRTSDVIGCGPGNDRVWYGPTDTFAADSGCEHTFLLAY
jgi:Ca2+-binding RTX toxin-like protein